MMTVSLSDSLTVIGHDTSSNDDNIDQELVVVRTKEQRREKRKK